MKKYYHIKAGDELFDEKDGTIVEIRGRHFSDYAVNVYTINDEGEKEFDVSMIMTPQEIRDIVKAERLIYDDEEEEV